ncbi:hypothetical protein [Faecalibacter sp. LW9]|uniref:hypothetical protein n=1 Tax=Faecalibacter sp. LW9 TaxID=3103144 RepID=UPI002B003023|nr:hypothetical protein [Faecalibacter sp. LW9]
MRNQYPSNRQIKKRFKKLKTTGYIIVKPNMNKIHATWLKMYNPFSFENAVLNKPVFPNVELRELTPEELANKKPKGRFQLRAESRKII